MSTRRLILTALVCGLAILVAGGIQLFRLADDEPVELPGLGAQRVVSGIAVTVVSVEDLEGRTVVTVELAASGADAAPALRAPGGEGWSLLRGTISSPVDVPAGGGTPCTDIAVTDRPQRCVVAFAPPDEGVRYLAFSRGGVEARWVLDA